VNEFEVVMVEVKVLTIGEDHPGKAHRLILNTEQLGHAAHQVLLKAGLFGEIVAAVDTFAHIQPAQEIMVFFWYSAQFLVGREVLQIGLDQRGAVLQESDQRVFALDDLVHNLIDADRSFRRGLGQRKPRCRRRYPLHGRWRPGLCRWWLYGRGLSGSGRVLRSGAQRNEE